MEVRTYFVVYSLNKVMGSKEHLSLEKVEFEGYWSNNFDTKEQAIEALVRDKKCYEDYVILEQVFITDYNS